MKFLLTLIGFFVVLLTNIQPGRYLANWIIDNDHYRYCNYSGNFTFTDQGYYKESHLKSALASCLKFNSTLLTKRVRAEDRVERTACFGETR